MTQTDRRTHRQTDAHTPWVRLQHIQMTEYKNTTILNCSLRPSQKKCLFPISQPSKKNSAEINEKFFNFWLKFIYLFYFIYFFFFLNTKYLFGDVFAGRSGKFQFEDASSVAILSMSKWRDPSLVLFSLSNLREESESSCFNGERLLLPWFFAKIELCYR